MRQILLAAAILATPPPLLAQAQAPAAEATMLDAVPASRRSLQGLPVVGQKGVVLGHVERVIPGPDGRPAQVLVRPKGQRAAGPRSLSFGAVTVMDKRLQTPLTKAEFEAMPAVDPSAG